MGLTAAGGAAWGVTRLGMMYHILARRSVSAAPALQRLVDHQAKQVKVSPPRARVCVFNRPLALTYGLRRPTLLFSTWLLENLDQRELEAVVAHELAHVARHDYLVVWLATILRDAFFYLPVCRAAYRQLQTEKEFACDDFAVGLTRRPLALASALAKVWQHSLGG